jgi:hypothetical protein
MRVLIKKKIGNQVQHLYPETYADVVMYNNSTTVASVLASILSDISDIKTALGINDTVYALDSNNDYITDSDGDRVIAISNATTAVQNNDNAEEQLDDGNTEDLVVSE